jgi:hypothetical protein
MEKGTLSTIAEQYPWASWAVWDEAFPDGDCIEETPEELVAFVSQHIDLLTPDIVLMGLNRSDDLPAPFSNFHAPTRKHYDYRLKTFIQDGELNRLHGAYMTDLVDEVDPDSHSVHVTDDDAAMLLDQLDSLGEPEYHIFCFGNKPFDGLVDYFETEVSADTPELRRATVETEGLILHLYRLWFYGLYGANQGKVTVVKRQLQELNQRLA